jgi:hypothetical protein
VARSYERLRPAPGRPQREHEQALPDLFEARGSPCRFSDSFIGS